MIGTTSKMDVAMTLLAAEDCIQGNGFKGRGNGRDFAVPGIGKKGRACAWLSRVRVE